VLNNHLSHTLKFKVWLRGLFSSDLQVTNFSAILECTVCYTKIYINLETISFIHITEIVVYIVCLNCRLCVCHSVDKRILLLLLLIDSNGPQCPKNNIKLLLHNCILCQLYI